MAKPKPKSNPFALPLLVLGTQFCLTAIAYGVMAFRLTHPSPEQGTVAGHPLMEFLRVHGMQLLLGELVLLAVATLGVIVVDSRNLPD